MNIIPYRFTSSVLPQSPGGALPGEAQGVYLTFAAEHDFLVEKIEGWFEDRDEVMIIDYGVSDKLGQGYLILEWEECEVDPLFLAILRDEEIVEDYTVYSRDLED